MIKVSTLQEPQTKRQRTGPHDDKSYDGGSSTKANMSNLSQNQAAGDLRPKKPLSAFVFFSQEFREILRQRFPFLTVNQVLKAVNFKWANMNKELKAPFE